MKHAICQRLHPDFTLDSEVAPSVLAQLGAALSGTPPAGCCSAQRGLFFFFVVVVVGCLVLVVGLLTGEGECAEPEPAPLGCSSSSDSASELSAAATDASMSAGADASCCAAAAGAAGAAELVTTASAGLISVDPASGGGLSATALTAASAVSPGACSLDALATMPRAIATITKKSLRLEVLGSYAQTEPVG